MPTPRTQPKPAGSPAALLYHDGELTDVRDLLAALGTAFVERRGELEDADRACEFDVVIATPRRMLSLATGSRAGGPTQIAICDSDTRSLRNSLRRAGIQLMVRRPVHPAVLRALLIHALYRGPEKRRHVRVSVGAPIHFRRRLRKRPAILADLSVGGCRLLTAHPVDAGSSIHIELPAEVAGGKPLALKGKVARCGEHESEGHTLTARFEGIGPKQLARLKEVVEAHASGPATLEQTAPAAAAAPSPKPASPPAAQAPARPVRPIRPAPPTPARAPARAPVPAPARAPSLGEAAERVLMGREISLGGMRVNQSPLLVVGQDVRLAIHVRDHDMPLVVTAKVHRDEGERGVVLRFHRLEPSSTRLLDRLLDTLPVIEPDGPDPHAGLIVSEILAEAQ